MMKHRFKKKTVNWKKIILAKSLVNTAIQKSGSKIHKPVKVHQFSVRQSVYKQRKFRSANYSCSFKKVKSKNCFLQTMHVVWRPNGTAHVPQSFILTVRHEHHG